MAAATLLNAYLTMLFFDERMQLVGENSSSQRVSIDGSVQTIALPNIQAPKNGYAYVYVSNESVEPVYFDNLQVGDNRGRIVEEDHYYAYGLKIAAISSCKLPDDNEGHVGNLNKYQGDFSEMDEEIGWNDFTLRNYDPQIGRRVQHDPYDQYPSAYIGMGGDPLNNIDEDGGISAGAVGTLTEAAVGFISGYLIARNNGGSILESLGAGAGGALIGARIGYGIGQTLSPAGDFIDPYSHKFFDNVAAFYKGLFNPGSASNFVSATNHVLVPDVWGSIGSLSLSVGKIPLQISFKVVEIWKTVSNKVVDPKDFINSPRSGQSTSVDPNFPNNNNIFRFDYDVNADPGDQNDKTRTIVKDIHLNEEKRVKVDKRLYPQSGQSYAPGRIIMGNKDGRLQVFFHDLPGYPNDPTNPLIPDIKYHLKKQKLVPVRRLKIKFGKQNE